MIARRSGLAAVLASLVSLGCEPLDDPSLKGFSGEPSVPAEAPHAADASGVKQLYWGDLHIHTALSSDAYAMGVRALPEDVYRFARGETIEHGAGYPITIGRPLDFVAVTDHAEFLGQARLADLSIPTTRQSLSALLREGSRLDVTRAWIETMALIRENGFKLSLDGVDEAVNRQAWEMSVAAAEANNRPGEFTTLIGWEWSATNGDDVSTHLHRNVIYGDSDVPEVPFSALDGADPPALWDFLREEHKMGRQVMAIPHNANLSAGGMYRLFDDKGQPNSELAAADRATLEPISEILQVKGASETHPILSALDEFAGFEIANVVPGREATLETAIGSYARDGLLQGLSVMEQSGFNPLEFGFIGSSDSHNASSSTDEDRYTGKLPMMDGSAGLRTGEAGIGLRYLTPATQWGSGGLAAVWASGNTRQQIFDALAQRETYATSGPRIGLRMFGGWDLNEAQDAAGNVIERLEGQAVPMGGRLTARPSEAIAPSFFVFASRDPVGANLDRIQIIKGWVDESGAPQERVINVAWSDGRSADPQTGGLAALVSTVNREDASYANTVGAGSLRAWWQDAEFDPERPAFYYARVLEIPTPRWSTYDAKRLGIPPMDPAVIQERAIGSPIWYVPERATSTTGGRE